MNPPTIIRRATEACFLLTLLVAAPSPAQRAGEPGGQNGRDRGADYDRSMGELFIEDFGIGIADVLAFAGEPLSWNDEWAYAGAGVGGTALLMTADEALRDFYQRHTISPGWSDAFDVADTWGTLSFAQAASAAVYAGGLFLRIDDVRVTGRLMAEGLVCSGLPSLLFQYVLGRSRPKYGEGAWTFNWFERDNEIQSMPSGHTAVAFAMSTVLAGRAGKWWVAVPLYGLATLTAAALVMQDEHWTSDVVAGAVLGFIGGQYALMRERGRAQTAAGPVGGRSSGDPRDRLGVSVGAGRITLSWRLM